MDVLQKEPPRHTDLKTLGSDVSTQSGTTCQGSSGVSIYGKGCRLRYGDALQYSSKEPCEWVRDRAKSFLSQNEFSARKRWHSVVRFVLDAKQVPINSQSKKRGIAMELRSAKRDRDNG